MAQAQRLGRTPLLPALSRLAARAPVAVFLVGAFLWAWLFWGYWAAAMPAGRLQVSPAFLLAAIAGGFAPSLAAIATTWLVGGNRAVRDLLVRITRWRHNLGWYAVATLLVPAIVTFATVLQSALVGPLRWPGMSAMLPLALVWPLMAALGEEVGWRGFLLPRLQSRFDILGAALIIGVIWGLWHLPADWIGLKAYGGWFWAAFLIQGPFLLTGHSIIMSWLWNRTHGSLLLMVLYHWSITLSAMLAPAPAATGPLGLLAAGIGAALVWVAAICLLIWRRQDF